jgi:Na+/H+ antiporter NhaD/arsenite permease-like protein
MIEILLLAVFLVGYLAIVFEHQLKIDKLIPALTMMAISWVIIALNLDQAITWFDVHHGKIIDISSFTLESKKSLLDSTLLHHFGKTTEILVFLMGAMAIVEMIDHFNGFGSIQQLIKTRKKKSLLWIIAILSFVLSAIIDNLTATIVLITILRKLIQEKELRLWYAGIIIIAANAGGAWTPIGDVTTTMLWMAGKVTTQKLVLLLGIPSLICMIIPVFIASYFTVFQGKFQLEIEKSKSQEGLGMLLIGLGLIISVPIFKTITHLPPYFGMMLALGIYAVISEVKSNRKFSMSDAHNHSKGPTLKALGKIEMPSILFFLGILMTIASMESLGMIFQFGEKVSATIPLEIFAGILGVASSIIDNVPLVAASIGMFSNYLPDHSIWHLIAYAAGTGGSLLIIGSAAGVVAMGMENISFVWYLKRISFLAALGYFAGLLILILLI